MKRLTIAVSAACLAVTVGAALAAEDPIEARQTIMKNIGKATGVGGAMAKGEMEYDAVKAQLVARTLNAGIIGYIELFPEGSEMGGDTKAKPEIWSNREGFVKHANELRQASAQMIESTPDDAESFRAAFGEMTGACKSCHEDFRVPSN